MLISGFTPRQNAGLISGRRLRTAESTRAAARARGGRRRTFRSCKIAPCLAVAVAAAWLTACSSGLELAHQPHAASPPDLGNDQARLYFYRPRESLFPAVRPSVIVNGRKAGLSVVGEAFYRDAQPGRYEIFLTSDDDERLTLTLEPGEVHYVRTSIAMGWLGPHLAPTAVEADQGAREIARLRLVEPRLRD